MVKWAPFYQLDAFTSELFRGNPAAICLMSTELMEKIYLDISREMNLSETAFLMKTDPGVYRLRWFTPVREVPLCGHATLAAAHLLFNHLGVDEQLLKFDTNAGFLYAENTVDGILMDFPSNPPKPVEPIEDVLNALGVDSWVDFQYSPGNQKLLVRLVSYEDVKSVKPDFGALLGVDNVLGWRGVVITSIGFDDYDFVSRYFAPLMGVNEDPVTGSNHTVLAPYWSRILGKRRLRAYQASRRGGSMIVEDKGDRVHLIGRSILVIKGEIQYNDR